MVPSDPLLPYARRLSYNSHIFSDTTVYKRMEHRLWPSKRTTFPVRRTCGGICPHSGRNRKNSGPVGPQTVCGFAVLHESKFYPLRFSMYRKGGPLSGLAPCTRQVRQQTIRCNLKAVSNAGRLPGTGRDRFRHLPRSSPGRAARMSGRLHRIG